MAVSENDTSDCNSDSSIDGMTKERREKPLTKVIIRRLPPSMTKEAFLEQVSPLPDYDYMYFVKADFSLGEYSFSRAYINFKNSSDIFIFKERFDNYVFLDNKGNEYTAVVEFAPFPRIPKRRNKTRVDPKSGSVETDPIYLTFVELLTKENDTELDEKPEYNVQPTTEDEKQKITNTPLLDFIKQRRIDRQKMREEKRDERKRRELERKRYRDDERRRKPKEGYPSKHISKNIQILNSTKDSNQNEEKRDEKSYKERRYESKYEDRKYEDKKYERKYDDRKHEDRKYEDRKYEDRKYEDRKYDDKKYEDRKYEDKKYDEKYDRKSYKSDSKYTYSRSKDVRKSEDYYKKPASKIRLRFEKTETKSQTYKREDMYHGNKKHDYTKNLEERAEKKVKKYSERREEHKNEIKKLETLKKDGEPDSKENENKTQTENKTQKHESRDDYDEKEYSYDGKEYSIDDKRSDSVDDKNEFSDGRENDPRSQRRIRNKDRPAMAIYQPGMGFRRNRSENDKSKPDSTEKSKPETACEN